MSDPSELQELAKLLAVSPEDYRYDVIHNGLHYGYPPCCIAFFVKVWLPLVGALTVDDAEGGLPDPATLDEMGEELFDVYMNYDDWIEPHRKAEAGKSRILCPACALKWYQQHPPLPYVME